MSSSSTGHFLELADAAVVVLMAAGISSGSPAAEDYFGAPRPPDAAVVVRSDLAYATAGPRALAFDLSIAVRRDPRFEPLMRHVPPAPR
jgi:hypothetical protein